jgi:hypothetical protein
VGPIHAEALAWLRFSKRCMIVATEVGTWSADVLGMNDKQSIEVEVKVSVSDLQAEFRHKEQKHWVYAHGGNGAPNLMYFCVPEELAEKAKAILDEKAPYAGLLSYNGGKLLAGRNLVSVKRPKELRETPPTARERERAIMRMSSQLCCLSLMQVDFQQRIVNQLQIAREDVLKAVEAFSSIPDIVEVP